MPCAACAPTYAYVPAAGGSATVDGRYAADCPIPPANPHGDVEIASFGFADLSVRGGPDDEKHAARATLEPAGIGADCSRLGRVSGATPFLVHSTRGARYGGLSRSNSLTVPRTAAETALRRSPRHSSRGAYSQGRPAGPRARRPCAFRVRSCSRFRLGKPTR